MSTCLVFTLSACDDLSTSVVPLDAASVTEPSHDAGGATTVTESDASATVDAPSGCVRNGCGGCTSLAAMPGQTCIGGSYWVCRTPDELACVALAPANVRASEDREADVLVSWSAPAAGTPSEYVVMRDANVIGTVPGTLRELADVAASASSVSAPTNLRATHATRTDGVELAWDPSSATEGDSHEYRVLARYDGVTSEAGNVARGRRSKPVVQSYDLTRDDGATWTALGANTTHLDANARLATLAGGTIVTTPEVSRSLVRLQLKTAPAVTRTTEHYRVRARTVALVSDASAIVDGTRGTGPIEVQWQRSLDSTAASFSSLTGVTGATWVDRNAVLDQSRFYRAVVSAPGAMSVTTPASAALLPELADVFVSHNGEHGCGLDSQGRARCWPTIPDGPNVALDSLALTWDGACGIRSSDKQLTCWPSGGTSLNVAVPVLSVAMGDAGRVCVIKASDHTLACEVPWGPPPDSFLKQAFTQIAMASVHICGLRTDGTVSCFSSVSSPVTMVPGFTDFVDVSLGADHACGRRADGSFYCWGDDKYGQLSIPPNTAFKQLRAGGFATCGLRSDDTLECWGTSLTDDDELVAPQTFRALKLGWMGCGVRTDGRTRCWGSGARRTPLEARFKSVSVAHETACGLLDDGRRVCWAGGPRAPSTETFKMDAVAIRQGCGVRDDGQLACWGSASLANAPAGSDFTSVHPYAGWGGACALRSTGQVWCWGSHTPTLLSGVFAQIEVDERMLKLYGLTAQGQVVTAYDGTLPGTYRSISHAGSMLLALDSNGIPSRFESGFGQGALSADEFTSVAAGDEPCAIRKDGALRCWSNFEYEPWPFDTFISVSVRALHRCAVRVDGRLMCWGRPSDATRGP